MRIAVLSDDPSTDPVIEALNGSTGPFHQTFAVLTPAQSAALIGRNPSVSVVERVEDLPLEKEIDAVLVAGSTAAILDGTKYLANAGTPILLVPRAAQGSTFAYELSLIRDENRVLLCPLRWHRHDEAFLALERALSDNQLGRLQYLQLTRMVSRPSASTPLSLADIDEELLADGDLLRSLIGDYDQVTCLRTASTSDGVMLQTVVLSGRSLPEANWSIAPTDGPSVWRLTVRGETGLAQLERDPSAPFWVLQRDQERVAGDVSQTARRLLDSFAAQCAEVPAGSRARPPESADEWGDLVKAFETVDASHRSVRRRRTIELHFEPMSERAIFKTQMTAIGCGLLIATFFLALVYLAVASFVEPAVQTSSSFTSDVGRPAGAEVEGDAAGRIKIAPLSLGQQLLRVLRVLVFAPLFVFLIAQVLLPLTRPSSIESSTSKDGDLEPSKPPS